MMDDDWFNNNVPYRPRYSIEESSDAAYEKDVKHRRCIRRKRRLVKIALLFVFIFVTGIVSRIHRLLYYSSSDGTTHNNYYTNETKATTQAYSPWGGLKSSSRERDELQFDLASMDSFGFFNTITNKEWKQIQHDTRASIDLQFGVMHRTSGLILNNGDNVNNVNNATLWWQENWNVNFNACKDALVNIGGVSICEPKGILSLANAKKHDNKKMKQRGRNKQQQPSSCIIYVSGGKSYIQFGEQFVNYLHNFVQEVCEIHIFTTADDKSLTNQSHAGVFIHPWGFHPSSSSNSDNSIMGNAFKTLQETIAELNHSSRISVLALDCEGCEWEIYRDILSLSSTLGGGGGGGGEPTILQVVMQMHGTPIMRNELFLAMQEAGYVIFNREDVGDGHVWDYSWLQLSPSFLNWTQ